MLLKSYSVYDSKVAAFMQPFFMQAHGAALRAFADLVNDPKTQICKYPEDFTLFYHGDFDDQSGLFRSEPAPVALGTGLEYKKAPPSQTSLEQLMSAQSND